MEAILGQRELPIMLPESRLAKLIMWKSHRELHRSTPADTVARSRKYAWICRAKKLAISVCAKCPICCQLHVKLGRQIMGDRQEDHMLPAPPFTRIACDLAGPFRCRGMVNTRSYMKTWAAVYICQGTGAVRVYLCPGYDTQSFLFAHEKFVAHCGNPRTITSDRGYQLRSAAKVLDVTEAESPMNWEWDKVKAMEARRGTDWIFISPGTQWRNQAEAAVKVSKHTLNLTLGSQDKLTFAELESVLMSAANTMNDRPISVRVIDEYTYHPITVNQLLLGRTTTDLSSVKYKEDGNTMERLDFKEEIESVWWAQFSVQVLPTLVPLTRWKESYPNRQVGDLVYVVYPGIRRSEYRIGKINKVYPDPKGKVRTVEVLMRPRDKRTDKNVKYI